MPYIDQIVLSLLVVGVLGAAMDHWRRGHRGWRLAALMFISFYGIGLVVTMAAHCADVIYNTVLGNKSAIDGSRFSYNWRTYSLLLFGALLIERGIGCVHAVRRVAAGHSTARADFLRSAGVALVITVPTIPLHAVFGILIAGWSTLALSVAAIGLRPRGDLLNEKQIVRVV